MKKRVLVIVIFLVIIILSLCFYYYTPVKELKNVESPKIEKSVNILLAGTDKKCSNQTVINTDTIILIKISDNQTRLTSIPRDTLVDKGDSRKINGIYYTHGMDILINLTENVTNTEIHRYILIDNMRYVRDLVDIIGGVNINISEKIIHNINLTDPIFCGENYLGYKNRTIFEKGVNKLNGTESIAYISRRNGGDINRVKKDQYILFEIMKKGQRISDPIKLLKIYLISKKEIHSNINIKEVLIIRKNMQNNNGQIKFEILEGNEQSIYNEYYDKNLSYWVPKK